jgi:hypothetical protein
VRLGVGDAVGDAAGESGITNLARDTQAVDCLSFSLEHDVFQCLINRQGFLFLPSNLKDVLHAGQRAKPLIFLAMYPERLISSSLSRSDTLIAESIRLHVRIKQLIDDE